MTLDLSYDDYRKKREKQGKDNLWDGNILYIYTSYTIYIWECGFNRLNQGRTNRKVLRNMGGYILMREVATAKWRCRVCLPLLLILEGGDLMVAV